MKKNKLLLLVALFPLLMSNSVAPIPYIGHDAHYSNFSVNSITEVIEENEDDTPIEDEEPIENDQKENEGGKDGGETTPVEPPKKENFLYTFNITNHGSYVIDSTITFVIDKKYEVTFGEDYIYPSKEDLCILPGETKDIKFDFKDYSYIFTEDFEFTTYSITGKEANAHRYKELKVSNFEIINRIVSADSSSTTFKVRYKLEDEPWDLFVGLDIRYSNEGKITSTFVSDPEAYILNNYLVAQFSLDGVKNSADIKTVDATIFLNANITSSTSLTEEGKIVIISFISILSALIIFAFVSLIIGLSSSKKEKELYKQRKLEEEEKIRKEKEEKERIKIEKRAKKEEEKRLKKEEKEKIKNKKEETSSSNDVKIETIPLDEENNETSIASNENVNPSNQENNNN